MTELCFESRSVCLQSPPGNIRPFLQPLPLLEPPGLLPGALQRGDQQLKSYSKSTVVKFTTSSPPWGSFCCLWSEHRPGWLVRGRGTAQEAPWGQVNPQKWEMSVMSQGPPERAPSSRGPLPLTSAHQVTEGAGPVRVSLPLRSPKVQRTSQ